MAEQTPPTDVERVRQINEQLDRENDAKRRGPKPNGAAQNGQDREEALRDLRVDIGRLSDASKDDDVNNIVYRIGRLHDLSQITRETLLKTINSQKKTTSLGALREQLRAVHRKPKQPTSLDDIKGILRDGDGGPPLALEANAILLIRSHPEMAGVLALDEFHQISVLMRAPPWDTKKNEQYPRPTRDADLIELLAWVQRQGIHIKGKQAIKAVLAAIIQDYVFHPLRDYLNSLKWDKKPRLDHWLTYYLGVKEVANYTAAVGRMWMISAVARIYEPGCAAKYMLVLEGEQDIGKSSALSILGGKWYSDDIAQLGTKDSQMQVGNAWIVELAELDSIRRADNSAIKAFISRKIDQFRPPYGEHVIRQERQNVLAATVNPAGPYLHDETGNVRFWPVAAIKIDLDALQNDRDQLWAEAVFRYKSGEKWWPDEEFDPHAAQEEASETAEHDPWFDTVNDWVRHQAASQYKTSEILGAALSIPHERMNRAAEMRLGKIMRRLGYQSKVVWFDGKPLRRWARIPG